MSLLTGEPRNATVVTREKCEFYVLDKLSFQAALQMSSSFNEQLREVFFQRQ